MRLQRFLAAAGLGSRRSCEGLITAGRVAIDGHTVTELGTQVDPDTQKVAVDGRPVSLQAPVFLAYYKPRGVICTANDPEGRPTVLDLLPPTMGRLFTVGRLDVESEGLLLVTNQGEFAHRVSHPRHGLEKVYHVFTPRIFAGTSWRVLLKGVESEGELLQVRYVRPKGRTPDGYRYEIVLGEGRNRHIRRMFEILDHPVRRLIRVAIGPLELETLRPGTWRDLGPEEIEELLAAAVPRRRSPPLSAARPGRGKEPRMDAQPTPPFGHPREGRCPTGLTPSGGGDERESEGGA